MADWIKDGDGYTARLGAGFDLSVTVDDNGYHAMVFGKRIGAAETLTEAQDAAVTRAHDILMGALNKL